MNIFSKLFGSPSIPQLDAAQVQSLLAQTPKPFLLDVRKPAEYRQGHIKEAKLIPLNDLPVKLAQIPKNREVICICASGSRSRTASRRLVAQGYRVYVQKLCRTQSAHPSATRLHQMGSGVSQPFHV